MTRNKPHFTIYIKFSKNSEESQGGVLCPHFTTRSEDMNKIEALLKEWNNGVLKGSQKKLATKLDVGESAVSGWISGRIKPGSDNIIAISKIFKKSEKEIKEIFGIQDKSKKDLPTMEMVRINNYVPFMGEIYADRFNCAILEETPSLYIPVLRGDDNDYAAKVRGDCMEPSLKEGTTIILRKCTITDVSEGEIVIARLEDECTLKRFYLESNTIWLIPDNDAYEPIFGSIHEIEIQAKVIDEFRPPARKRRPKFLEEKNKK
ncbi:Transcriptional regulator, XRE family [Elusimicrobium minutum Pei191]|uniref:Transcriptional regulator, XRE family n=2 Tax=Elusimicrobium TaxID=423604 RepID=B2KDE4_ELUMP|nr:Transcriptional regulator, XRE family [Elusimicrobium minutum Pei191]